MKNSRGKRTGDQKKDDSGKMPKEDVERLLDALKDDDQNLKWYFTNMQKKSNKKKTEKDW